MADPFQDPSVKAAQEAPNPFGDKTGSYDTSFWQADNTGNNVNNSSYGANAYDNANNSGAYDMSPAYDESQLSGKISSSAQSNNVGNAASQAYSNNNVSNNNNLNNSNNNNNNRPNNNFNNNINNNSSVTHSELDLREENLRRKERELQERQARLNGLQEEIAQSNYREDNWPSKCYPVTFHSITQEIPPFARGHMRKMYSLVMLTFVTLIWNFFAEMAIFLTESGESSSKADSDILWATVYVFAGSFAAWKLWYRQIYYGLRDRKTLKWWMFFVFFIVHIGFACYMAIGIENGSGAAGFILMFTTLQNNFFAGLCNLIAAVLWTIITLASVFLIKRSWNLYRQRGGLEQARTELTREAAKQVIKNPGLLQV